MAKDPKTGQQYVTEAQAKARGHWLATRGKENRQRRAAERESRRGLMSSSDIAHDLDTRPGESRRERERLGLRGRKAA